MYFCFLLVLVQFSSGVRAVFYWCLCSFRHPHTPTTNTYMHKNKCTLSHTDALTHAHINPDSNTHIHRLTETHNHTRTHSVTQSHSQTHTHIHTQTYRRSHAQTPTHTCERVLHMYSLLERFRSFPPFQQFHRFQPVGVCVRENVTARVCVNVKHTEDGRGSNGIFNDLFRKTGILKIFKKSRRKSSFDHRPPPPKQKSVFFGGWARGLCIFWGGSVCIPLPNISFLYLVCVRQ